MTAFAPLLGLLEAVPDPRRAEGKIYPLPHVLLFSILAIVSGGNSYRSVVTFIEVHRRSLNTSCLRCHIESTPPAGTNPQGCSTLRRLGVLSPWGNRCSENGVGGRAVGFPALRKSDS